MHSFDLEQGRAALVPARPHPRGHRARRDASSRARACEPDVHGWLATGEVPSSSTARIWISPERARWAREDRRVVEELRTAPSSSSCLRLHDWLSREILKEAGDAVVLEPEEARAAVLEAAEALAGAVRR